MNHSHSQTGMTARHGLIMLLCCLVPLAAIGAIVLFDIPLSTTLFAGMLLLCPLLHVGMMWGMMRRGHHTSHSDAPAAAERERPSALVD